MMRKQALPVLLFAAAILAAAACKKTETASSSPPPTTPVASTATGPSATEVRVTDVQVGKAVGADKKISQPADSFSPTDTIFVSVTTEGSSPSATIRANWKYQDGQTVKDDSRTITQSGTAVTEFSIQKPDGWPKGNYTVEVSANGGTPTTKSFRVG